MLDQFGHFRDRIDQHGSAAGHNSFFDGCTRCGQSVFDAEFSFFQFDFRCGSDLNHGDPAGQFCQAFLEFFTVEIGIGGFDLIADLLNALGDFLFRAVAADDDGVFFAHLYAARTAEHVDRGVFQVIAEFFCDDGCVRQNGDVLQHFFSAVSEARCLDGHTVEGAAEFVHNERCQGFAFDVFRDQKQRCALLDDLL